MKLDGTKTLENLKAAFAGESQANRRYLYFAEQADTEGNTDVSELFRSVSNGETKHAFGHIGYLDVDPVTGEPIGDSEKNLKAAIAGEVYEFTEMYPGFARVARDEGHEEIAEWFEVMAKAEKVHAGRFEEALTKLTGKRSGMIPA
ncbi:MAG: rubrerythrin family protein [Euryarchaeota archaeon]|nr:rubrerythrin family protein [Euryarchaeota archaeon]